MKLAVMLTLFWISRVKVRNEENHNKMKHFKGTCSQLIPAKKEEKRGASRIFIAIFIWFSILCTAIQMPRRLYFFFLLWSSSHQSAIFSLMMTFHDGIFPYKYAYSPLVFHKVKNKRKQQKREYVFIFLCWLIRLYCFRPFKLFFTASKTHMKV